MGSSRAAGARVGWRAPIEQREIALQESPSVRLRRGLVAAWKRLGPVGAAALVTFALSLALYLQTLAPSIGFSDWGEMTIAPVRLDVAHPTGYPLFILLGKLWSLLPIGSVAYRMNLLSAVTSAAAAAMVPVIAGRLGVRAVLGAIAGLGLTVSGALWDVSNLSEANGLHLWLMAIAVWLALRWRDERRPRDLLAGSLLLGLAASNHILTVTVALVIVPWALWIGRRDLIARPILVPAGIALGALGLLPYAFIPIRAALGPKDVYGFLTTWDGFYRVVSGSDFHSEMHFTSVDSLTQAWRFLPDLAAMVQQEASLAFLALGVVGAFALVRRDPAAGVLTVLLAAANVYFFVSYRHDLTYFLLLTWLMLAVWSAVAMEEVVRHVPVGLRDAQVLFLLVPLVAVGPNFNRYDLSTLHTGDEMIQTVLAQLPRNAVLFTYWDIGTALEYGQCVEGLRPDVSVITPNDTVSYRPCHDIPLADVPTSGRPVYALVVQDYELDRFRTQYTFTQVATIRLPYGTQIPTYDRPLWRLDPLPGAIRDGTPSTRRSG